MQILVPIAEKIAKLLKDRGETVTIAESSAGGLISAALLSVPGASAYFLGGGVVYTRQSREAIVGISIDDLKQRGIRSSSEPYAALLAERIREKHGASWALSETGAAGPSGNRYGDPAGHTCIAVNGAVMRTLTVRTGNADRQANMRAFALEALETFAEALEAAPKPKA